MGMFSHLLIHIKKKSEGILYCRCALLAKEMKGRGRLKREHSVSADLFYEY